MTWESGISIQVSIIDEPKLGELKFKIIPR